jgi:hypothetical protein
MLTLVLDLLLPRAALAVLNVTGAVLVWAVVKLAEHLGIM